MHTRHDIDCLVDELRCVLGDYRAKLKIVDTCHHGDNGEDRLEPRIALQILDEEGDCTEVDLGAEFEY